MSKSRLAQHHSAQFFSVFFFGLDYLLACSLTGVEGSWFGVLGSPPTGFSGLVRLWPLFFFIIRELLRRGASSTPYMEPDCWADSIAPLSAWGAFLNSKVPQIRLSLKIKELSLEKASIFNL